MSPQPVRVQLTVDPDDGTSFAYTVDSPSIVDVGVDYGRYDPIPTERRRRFMVDGQGPSVWSSYHYPHEDPTHMRVDVVITVPTKPGEVTRAHGVMVPPDAIAELRAATEGRASRRLLQAARRVLGSVDG